MILQWMSGSLFEREYKLLGFLPVSRSCIIHRFRAVTVRRTSAFLYGFDEVRRTATAATATKPRLRGVEEEALKSSISRRATHAFAFVDFVVVAATSSRPGP